MLRIVFIGQAVERKGLPILLRAFEALREHIAGGADHRRRADQDEVAPTPDDPPRGVRGARHASATRRSGDALRDADVLCAPSLGGESFGMVLTEAYAAARRSSHPTSPATGTSCATA